MTHKKGQMSTATAGLAALVTVVILFVVLGVVGTYGSDIIADTQTDLLDGVRGCNSTHSVNCSVAYNNTANSLEGLQNVTDKFPTLSNVLIGAFIILILVSAFGAFLVLRR